MAPTLLVLAAGMGSRYGGLKQIDPVGPSGETVLDYSVHDAMGAGFGRVVFVIRRELEGAFRASVTPKYAGRIAVGFVFQSTDELPEGCASRAGREKPWGTGHAVWCARAAVEGPFAVINADDFYGSEGYRVLVGHLTSGSPDYAMVGFTLRNTLSDFGSVARGVCQVDAHGNLSDVVEMLQIERDGAHAKNTAKDGAVTPLDGTEPVSMNMWAFTPAIFPQLREKFDEFMKTSGTELKAECLIPNTINQLVKAEKARVKVLHTNDSWFGVTYREDHPNVVSSIRALIGAGKYPERLWS
jgi:UTP-glucose-1-phosphate uridylyltransferase